MTGPRSPFDPAEVSGLDLEGEAAEIRAATAAARALEASMSSRDAAISPDLADRIMVAVRRVPPPRAIGVLDTLRRRPSPAGVLESLGLAWARLVSAGSVAVRASALAYVALILVIGVSVTGAAAYAAAGAFGLFSQQSRVPDASQPAVTLQPIRSPSRSEDAESPEPSERAQPTDTAEPTESAGDEHQGGTGSGDGPSATPGDGEDGGGDASSSSSPSPSSTLRPGETPSPTSDN